MDAGSLTGDIDGGAGSDTLDYSAVTTAVTTTLTGTSSTDGFAGMGSKLNAFTHINTVTGGTSSDTLTGGVVYVEADGGDERAIDMAAAVAGGPPLRAGGTGTCGRCARRWWLRAWWVGCCRA